MTDKLRGAFHGCPHHGGDYEACIQHSGTAPCGVTEELEHTQGQRDDAIQRAQAAEDRADALAAHVELLREAFKKDYQSLNWTWVKEVLDEAPATSLAQRDDEQFRQGFWWGFERARCHPDQMNIRAEYEEVASLRTQRRQAGEAAQ